LTKRLRKCEHALFDTLIKFGLDATGSPPTIEVSESRLPTLFAALKEIGCSSRDSDDGECIVIEQLEETISKEQNETQKSHDKDSKMPNSTSGTSQAKRVVRPSSAPASRRPAVDEATRLKADVEKEMQWPRVPLAFQQPKQTLEEQHKSAARLSMKKRAPPRSQEDSCFGPQAKRAPAPNAEMQRSACDRLSAPLKRMPRTQSEASLSERGCPKTQLTSNEQDSLFARLAVPRKGEHTVIVDVENLSDSDHESPAWTLKKRQRPSSASQQRFCDRLAIPKKRLERPRSAAGIRVADSSAQQSLCRRLSNPKRASGPRATINAGCRESSQYKYEDAACSEMDTFTSWGVFDEKKARFWAQQQAHALEMLEQAQEMDHLAGNVLAEERRGLSPKQASTRSRPSSASSCSPRHQVLEHLTGNFVAEERGGLSPKQAWTSSRPSSASSCSRRHQALEQAQAMDHLAGNLLAEEHGGLSPKQAPACSRPASASSCTRRPQVPKLPRLESLVHADNSAPSVPKLPLESLMMQETCNVNLDTDPFSTDLDTSHLSSSLSSSDFSSICGDNDDEGWTVGMSAQLPQRILPIQRPQCLASPDDEQSITNNQGLVGWQLTRGCVPWA
jgi:hypothetical protein